MAKQGDVVFHLNFAFKAKFKPKFKLD